MIAKLERTQSNAQQNKDNPSFEQIVSQIYQIAFQLNMAYSFDTEAIFMHLDLSITNGIVHLKCMINGLIFVLKRLICHFLFGVYLDHLPMVYKFRHLFVC